MPGPIWLNLILRHKIYFVNKTTKQPLQYLCSYYKYNMNKQRHVNFLSDLSFSIFLCEFNICTVIMSTIILATFHCFCHVSDNYAARNKIKEAGTLSKTK